MFSITKKQGIALIELNSPPVNALDLKMRKALSASIAELGTDDEIKAMVYVRPCRCLWWRRYQ